MRYRIHADGFPVIHKYLNHRARLISLNNIKTQINL